MSKEENDIQQQVKAYLKLLGFWVIRVQCGQVRVKGGFMHLAQTGTSDLITWLPWNGKIFAIETKTPINKLSDDQKIFRDEILKSKGHYLCAKSLQCVIIYLDNIRRLEKRQDNETKKNKLC